MKALKIFIFGALLLIPAVPFVGIGLSVRHMHAQCVQEYQNQGYDTATVDFICAD
jgi:hypothetical protein